MDVNDGGMCWVMTMGHVTARPSWLSTASSACSGTRLAKRSTWTGSSDSSAPRTLRRKPLDAATEAELQQSVADAPNDRIGAALLKLGRAVLLKEREQNLPVPRKTPGLTKK